MERGRKEPELGKVGGSGVVGGVREGDFEQRAEGVKARANQSARINHKTKKNIRKKVLTIKN